MNTDKVYLGKLKSDAGSFADGKAIYLSKHEWSCDWYWSFGFLGNSNCHFHFDSLLYIKDNEGSVKYEASKLFAETKISDKDWWIIRDLFVQAYALKGAAEVYQHGGSQSSRPGVTDILKNKEKADALNADLKLVLDTLWDFILNATKVAK